MNIYKLTEKALRYELIDERYELQVDGRTYVCSIRELFLEVMSRKSDFPKYTLILHLDGSGLPAHARHKCVIDMEMNHPIKDYIEHQLRMMLPVDIKRIIKAPRYTDGTPIDSSVFCFGGER